MGEQFGRYQILELAGSGGMATVNLARQVGPSGFVKPCVLKRISREFAGDPSVRKMFLEEARISALLNHPNIVQTFDYGEVEGAPYMAMELVDGVNLAQLCRTLAKAERWIPLRACVEICLAVADALTYAHELTDLGGKNIHLVHRDVSPQNILVSRRGSVKLADFGIARHDARDQVTVGISTKGKPGYMAPEQAMGADIDHRADLFSLGIVLTELIGARRVMRSGNAVAGILSLSKRVRELVELRKNVTPELRALALSLTALEPDERPASARQTSEELRRIAAGIPERVSLPVFLEKAFSRFYPSGAFPAAVDQPGSNDGTAGLTVVDPNKESEPSQPAEEHPTVEPPRDQEADGWTKPESPATGSAAVYDRGWPKEYLEPSAPKLELVSRSSSVDAMKYFGAQGSVHPTPADPDGAPAGGPVFGEPPRRPGHAEGPARSKGPGLPSPSADGQEPRPMPKVLTALLEETPRPPSPLRRAFPLAAATVLLAGGGFGVLTLVSGRTPPPPPPPPTTGSVQVVSTPEGAAILVDGVRSGRVTPAEIPDLPLDRAVRIAVALDGHVAAPEEASIVIPSGARRTTASFTLERGRVFHLSTTPAGAMVSLGAKKLRAITPMDLPPIAYGDTATLALALEGHLPGQVVVRSMAGTATVVEVKLEPAREVDVVSEPPGAKVFIDNEHRGVTPAYDLSVPAERSFKVRVERKGFKTWRQTLSAKRLRERLIEAELVALPLLSMPLTKEEKEEARDYERKLSATNLAIRRNKARLAKAEKALADVESSPNIFIGRIADAQREVDDARSKLEELDTTKTDLEGQIDLFRQRVMSKLDGTD